MYAYPLIDCLVKDIFMGLAVWSLLLCDFCSVSSGCWHKVTVLGFVMALIIDGKFPDASFGTVNYTMPNFDEDKDKEDNWMCGLVESSKS